MRFIFILRGSGGGIWYDYVHGYSAIFPYVYIAGGGVRYISLIFARVLAHGIVERADRKRRHLGLGFERLLFLRFFALLGCSFAHFVRW